MKKLLFISAILVAGPGFAQTAAPAGSGQEQPNPSETICRTIADTGSRLSRSRVCMTRAQWEQQRREMREQVERGQQRQVNPQG